MVAPRVIRVALAGNPNAGKTTVFNALCGARQKTGNYAGVTVERKLGRLKQHPEIEILDLPGTYSLKAKSTDESITTEVLLGHAAGETKPDLVLTVLDASNLKRSLYLTLQLKELGLPMVGVLTMADIAARRGLAIDIRALEKQLGFPVCAVTLAGSGQIEELSSLITSPGALHAPASPPRAAAGSVDDAGLRYAAIDKILQKVVKKENAARGISEKIDAVLTHRVFGLLAFALIIGGVFFSIYAGARPVMDAIDAGMKAVGGFLGGKFEAYPVTASLLSDGVIAGAGSVFVFLPQIMILFFFISVLEETGYLARAAFLMDKLLGWTGLNGRAFIPLLSSFACAIPGILSARVMPTDRARMATILIAPLMSCSARLPVYVLFIGAFIEPRLGALWAAAALFGMHLVGIAVAMPLAWLLNRKILKTGESPFILELPEYRRPYLPNVFRRVYDAATDFLKRVGTIIFALSIIIWALAYFPHRQSTYDSGISTFAKSADLDRTAVEALLKKNNLSEAEAGQKLEVENALRAAYLRDSFLGTFGRAVEPVFRPLGFDWKISVAILAAFPAREVFVSTLGIIFSVTDAKDDPAALGKKLAAEKKADGKPAYDTLLALSIMIFFALCAQCMSTLATVRRELGSTGWAVGLFFAMTSLAYVISLAVYQIGRKLA
ncbi:MAG: ferrous iron transporter B [Turneriella sp.]|nr:ferrous iron transporter B [Turneriella sp.]